MRIYSHCQCGFCLFSLVLESAFDLLWSRKNIIAEELVGRWKNLKLLEEEEAAVEVIKGQEGS